MFTGIIESMGVVQQITTRAGNKTFWIKSSLFPELKIDQSLSHNRVCLTAFGVRKRSFKVVINPYTLQLTNLQFLKEKEKVNLEFDIIGKYIQRITSLFKNK
jgi:riboflavin synthase